MNDHPPKPPLALAVGIIGHRLNRLPEDVRGKVAREIDEILGAVGAAMVAARKRHGDVFSGLPVAALVGSLAEGADRIAAQAALARSERDGMSWVVDAVLPFPAEELAADFTDAESRREFEAMVGRARAILALPGSRADESAAYESAAFTVLGQSDIVIAVWDGGPSAGRGGTTESIEVAVRDGLPIIVIDATGTGSPRLYWGGLTEDSAPTHRLNEVPSDDAVSAIPRLVSDLVCPPTGSAAGMGGRLHHEDEARSLMLYLAEEAPRRNPFIGFPLLQVLFGVRKMSPADMRPPAPAALAAQLLALSPPADAKTQSGAASPLMLAAAYGWADFAGALLAQIFRGAFILNFVFAALAVACAAVSIVQHDWKPWLVCLELVLIVTVVVNTWLGWRRQWHRRWFEGRELAERLRVALLLWMVGLRPDGANGVEPTWTGWYARAVVRAQGLRHVHLDAAGVAAARIAAATLLDEQCGYHQISAERMHRLDERLEYAGLACLILTILVAAAYLFLKFRGLAEGVDAHGEGWDIGLTVAALTAGLPALATATYGMRVIGDFAGISRRSERTRHGLEVLVKRLNSGEPSLHLVRARVRAAAEVMLGDVAGWRLSAESRGLAIPG